MSLIRRVLWAIESHDPEALSLETLAERVGVSRFHLARAFEIATGCSVMRYARGRRLTEAARHLAAGRPSVLSVALDAGYGSHEAFSRAFRKQFGVTPETVRDRRHLDNLLLVEPLVMDETKKTDVKICRFEEGRTMLIAGLGDRYRFETNQGIPQLWRQFVAHIGHIPNQVGGAAYGVCCNADDAGNFDYIAGVEVDGFDDLPKDFTRLRIESQRYAVFEHKDNISSLRDTVYAIWNQALEEAGLTVANSPDFELYGEAFDPKTGDGGVEIWVPVKT